MISLVVAALLAISPGSNGPVVAPSSQSKQPASAAILPILFDSSNGQHRDFHYHPEQPKRISETFHALKKAFGSDSPTINGDDNIKNEAPQVVFVDVATEPEDWIETATTSTLDATTTGPSLQQQQQQQQQHWPFSTAELESAKQALKVAHEPDLVTKLEESSQAARERRASQGKTALGHMGYIDHDTYVTTQSFDVSVRATAAWIRATNLLVPPSSSSSAPALLSSTPPRAAMALTRPPGHHATRHVSNGFCLYNFAATAAVAFLQRNPSHKVSVLDWDVHYGQGVADILKDHPNSRYVSIHQIPAFPFEGERRQQVGNILTLPILADTSWTCGYQQSFQEALKFVAERDVWEPDLVIVCAGYDALDSDELASVSLQAQDYNTMAKQLVEHLDNVSSSPEARPTPILLGLEGGYQLKERAGGGNLQTAVVRTLQAFL